MGFRFWLLSFETINSPYKIIYLGVLLLSQLSDEKKTPSYDFYRILQELRMFFGPNLHMRIVNSRKLDKKRCLFGRQ